MRRHLVDWSVDDRLISFLHAKAHMNGCVNGQKIFKLINEHPTCWLNTPDAVTLNTYIVVVALNVRSILSIRLICDWLFCVPLIQWEIILMPRFDVLNQSLIDNCV